MPAAAAVRLTWKALGPDPYDRDRGDSSDSGRSTGMLWPAVATNTASEVPPTRARAPRREMVGRPGLAATRLSPAASSSPGMGASGDVAASPVASSARKLRERNARHIRPNLRATCTVNPAMKAHAP